MFGAGVCFLKPDISRHENVNKTLLFPHSHGELWEIKGGASREGWTQNLKKKFFYFSQRETDLISLWIRVCLKKKRNLDKVRPQVDDSLSESIWNKCLCCVRSRERCIKLHPGRECMSLFHVNGWCAPAFLTRHLEQSPCRGFTSCLSQLQRGSTVISQAYWLVRAVWKGNSWSVPFLRKFNSMVMFLDKCCHKTLFTAECVMSNAAPRLKHVPVCISTALKSCFFQNWWNEL